MAVVLWQSPAQAWDWELVDDRTEAHVVSPNGQLNGDLTRTPDVTLDDQAEASYRVHWENATSAAYASEFQNVAQPETLIPPPLHLPDRDFGSVTVLVDANNSIIGPVTNFNDLSQFNAAFGQTTSRSLTGTRDLRVYRTLTFRPDGEDNEDDKATHGKSRLTLAWGARYYDLQNAYAWDGRGSSFLGQTLSDYETVNRAFGPHLSLGINHTDGAWQLLAKTDVTLGYQQNEALQRVSLGEDLAPSQPNGLLFMQPTSYQNRLTSRGVAPLLETRVGAWREISAHTKIGAQWSAFYLANMQAASDYLAVERLSDLGLSGPPSSDIFQHTLMFTLEHRR